MSKASLARAAAAVMAAIAVPVLLAGPALAYPPGTDPTLMTPMGGYAVGTPIPATISNLLPGCTAQFTVLLNGTPVGTAQSAKVGTDGSASTTIPAQTSAGAYTIVAQGVGTAARPDCASASTSTTVVITSSRGGNSGSSVTPSSGPVPAASGGGILTTIGDAVSGVGTYLADHQRVRNGLLLVLLALGGWLFLIAWRRRHDDEHDAPIPPTG